MNNAVVSLHYRKVRGCKVTISEWTISRSSTALLLVPLKLTQNNLGKVLVLVEKMIKYKFVACTLSAVHKFLETAGRKRTVEFHFQDWGFIYRLQNFLICNEKLVIVERLLNILLDDEVSTSEDIYR